LAGKPTNANMPAAVTPSLIMIGPLSASGWIAGRTGISAESAIVPEARSQCGVQYGKGGEGGSRGDRFLAKVLQPSAAPPYAFYQTSAQAMLDRVRLVVELCRLSGHRTTGSGQSGNTRQAPHEMFYKNVFVLVGAIVI
jgi:hypothetical protein